MTKVPFPQANDLGKILNLICKFENYSNRDLYEVYVTFILSFTF